MTLALDIAFRNDTKKYVPIVENMLKPITRNGKEALLWVKKYNKEAFEDWKKRVSAAGFNPHELLGQVVEES